MCLFYLYSLCLERKHFLSYLSLSPLYAPGSERHYNIIAQTSLESECLGSNPSTATYSWATLDKYPHLSVPISSEVAKCLKALLRELHEFTQKKGFRTMLGR